MKRILSLGLALIIIFSCFSAMFVSFAENSGETVKKLSEPADGFIEVLNNGGYTLYFSQYTGSIALQSKSGGHIWYSNPQNINESIEGNSSPNLKSQLIFRYYNGSALEVMDSYSFGILNENIPDFTVEDGILKVFYLIGNTEFSIDMLPPVMTKESMEKDILSKLNDEDKAKVTERYTYYERDILDSETYKKVELSFPSIKDGDLYILGSGMPSYIAKGIYEIFLKSGYTVDDLQKYCDENGVENRYEEKPYFKAQLDYSLNENGLNVTLSPKNIEYAKAYPPTRVDILPYFGAADDKTDGYMLVPDGSGAYINFNNGKTSNGAYEKHIYTTDAAILSTTKNYGVKETSLPFFGLASKNGSFIASIKKGYEVAGVFADISGRNSSYNSINPYFTVFSTDVVSVSGHQLDNFVKSSENIFSDDYSIDYIFTDKYSSYSELAVLYRDYLIDSEILKNKSDDKCSINLSFIGTTEVTKSFWGIPYKTMQAYTTLLETEEIIKKLNTDNADIRLTDFTKGGRSPKNTASLKLQRCVGKLRDIKNLYSISDTAYLSVYSIYQAKASNSKKAAAISQDDAYKLNYNFVNGFKENSKYLFLLTSEVLGENSKKLIKQINKNKLEAINLRDIGYELNSDYDSGNETDRHQSRVNSQKFMEVLSEKAKLSVDKGSIFALPYVDKIWDIPMSSSNYHILDGSIPFYQIAISGYVCYTAPAFNDDSEIDLQFLKALEYGAQPQFTLTYRSLDGINYYQENYYSYQYENHISSIKEINKRYSDISKEIFGSSIISHRNNGDYAVIEYDNGVELYINYTESNLTVDNTEIKSLDVTLKK